MKRAGVELPFNGWVSLENRRAAVFALRRITSGFNKPLKLAQADACASTGVIICRNREWNFLLANRAGHFQSAPHLSLSLLVFSHSTAFLQTRQLQFGRIHFHPPALGGRVVLRPHFIQGRGLIKPAVFHHIFNGGGVMNIF